MNENGTNESIQNANREVSIETPLLSNNCLRKNVPPIVKSPVKILESHDGGKSELKLISDRSKFCKFQAVAKSRN